MGGRAHGLVSLVLAGLLAGCDATGARPGQPPEEPVPSGSMPAAPPPPPAAEPPPPAARAAGCPAGMREVEGAYCTALVHRCIKGGRRLDGQASGSPSPYHCDEYQPGYARCLGAERPLRFCIDDFEFPNQEGATPAVMVTWHEARSLCQLQGKRLCGDDEWTLACEGPERLPYPYGWKRDRSACNIDRPWRKPDDGALAGKDLERLAAELERLSQSVPSGSMPGCVSPFGVHDMGGNVDEWTVNVTLHGRPFRSMFKGGHWCGGARNRCRPTTESHDETTAYYAEGFRCCADLSRPPPTP
jgi:formylglycine-generating enzyme